MGSVYHRLLVLLLALLLAACSSPATPPASTTLPTAATLPSAPSISTPLPALPSSTLPPTSPMVPPTNSPLPQDYTATPSGSATTLDELALLAATQRQPRDKARLASELGAACPELATGCPEFARTTPLEVQVGDRQDFWVTNFSTNRNYTVTAELRYAGPIVLMYVELGLEIDQAALEQAARTFEQTIYPRTRSIFGSEMQPGVDGDPRITVLNARSTGGGILGYFSERDTVPQQVNRFSNEREMFFMNADALTPGTPAYLDTLTHEFQHMIHWNEQLRSPTWFNEGCSTLAEDLNGFINTGYANAYLQNPDTQLTGWGNQASTSLAHYGAASLFMRYIYAHYAGDAGILPLIRANAGNNLAAFVQLAAQKRPDVQQFGDLVADWAVANLLDNPNLADGRYTYATGHALENLLPARVQPQTLALGETSGTVRQFGVDYLALPPGPVRFEFNGNTSVSLVGTAPQNRYAWWSGRGDNSVATLTRSFDLRGLSTATLQFSAWYEIENDYDYAFISISTNGGQTWQSLRSSSTSDADPQGTNFGHGFTGVSGAPGVPFGSGTRGAWVEETADLTPYVGQEVQLRFWQISDLAINGPGLLIDNIRLPELGYSDDVETDNGGWQASGFARVDGDLPQAWALRLVRTAANGSVRVEALATDADGRISATLADGEQAVLVVLATTPYTSEPGSYRLLVTN